MSVKCLLVSDDNRRQKSANTFVGVVPWTTTYLHVLDIRCGQSFGMKYAASFIAFNGHLYVL